MLHAGGARGIAGCGARGSTAASSPLASSWRPHALRAPLFHAPRCPFRTLRAPQLTVVNVSRPSDSPVPAAPRSFEQLGLQPNLVSALQGLGITEPTDIQSLAIPALTQRPGNYFLASHTGSGKTLAYLLPLVQALKAEEAAGFVPRPKRPRVLVLGPTRELTEQITGVAKRLCHTAKFRAACLNAYRSMADQSRFLAGPVDVLVATPTRFLQHVKEGNVFYRDIRWLVVDEADTVFEQGWGPEVASILAPLRTKPQPANVLLVTASLAKPVQRAIRELVPDAQELKTSTLHKAVSGSSHQFLTLPPGANKLQLLAEILGSDSRRSQKVLVFCNTMDSCRAVEHFSREEGMRCVCYHGEMPGEERQPIATSLWGDGGVAPLGCTKAKLGNTYFNIADELAQDEIAHVRLLRAVLGNLSVPQPLIDIGPAFAAAGNAAASLALNKSITLDPLFSPYDSDITFLHGAFIFEDVGATAYAGAAALIVDKAYLTAAAQILAAEAYHGGAVRFALTKLNNDRAPFKNLPGLKVRDVIEAISALRDAVDGPADTDQGIVTLNRGKWRSNLNPADSNGLIYTRNTDQVLRIVYLGGSSKGGFFPNGLNGGIKSVSS
ncbi:hypothetical protein GPECTOR_71g588 [Gonium pectorale]|uniref:RNA helicase n=1 Tax=Gonium pectorale TaxID=33097 RepID=A0A150G2Z7_GONPE|nr:hypothetical protein GPECTOR_71g588 [Gonium pectorale]|eukprot:KXZ44227.1 hypothetical protein GPECTOR_71g588 [Gonium pectorale]